MGQRKEWVIGMTNVTFRIEGKTGYGTLPDSTTFLFDAEQIDKIKDIKWYRCYNKKYDATYITNRSGRVLHKFLVECPSGYEVDHINRDTMDNRQCNLRICTHQQNQCNQALQKNNTSGVSGVSYYPPRSKFRARIKVSHQDIHLGYYSSFEEAVQARNVGMSYMFGEYAIYNDAPDPPSWIREKVIAQCRRFADLSICKAFSSSDCVA